MRHFNLPSSYQVIPDQGFRISNLDSILLSQVKIWGIKFSSMSHFWGWIGILLFVTMSMIDRSILSVTLDNTVLDGLNINEVMVIFLMIYIILFCNYLPINTNSSVIKYERYLTYFILCMSLTFIISLIFSPTEKYDLIIASNMYRKYIISILLGYLLVKKIANDNQKANIIIIASIISGLIIAIAISTGNIEDVFKLSRSHSEGGQIPLPLGFMISVGGNTMSLYLLLIFLINFSLLVNNKLIYKIIAGVNIAVICYALILLATRSVLLSLFPGCFMVLFLSKKMSATSKIFIISFGLMAAIYLIMTNLDTIMSQFSLYQEKRITIISAGAKELMKQNSFEARLGQYSAFASTILTEPFGYGMMGLYPQYFIQPHSLILRLLLTSGWLGCFFYFAFITKMTLFWYRRITLVDQFGRSFLIGMVTFNTIMLLISWGYDFMNRFDIQLTYFILCGLATTIACRKNQANSTNNMLMNP